jgi:hypothetical protein
MEWIEGRNWNWNGEWGRKGLNELKGREGIGLEWIEERNGLKG